MDLQASDQPLEFCCPTHPQEQTAQRKDSHPTLETLKARLDGHLNNLMLLMMSLPMTGGLKLHGLEDCLQPKLFHDSPPKHSRTFSGVSYQKIMEWFGLGGTLRMIQSNPLLWTGTPSIIPD